MWNRRNLLVAISIFSIVIVVNGFVRPAQPKSNRISASNIICNSLVSAEALGTIGYTVTVNKPMGVVFGENRAPFFGLVVDDIELAGNGAKAGLRIGDQLLTVDGKPVVGRDFDNIMKLLRESPDPLVLDLYRGTAQQMYTVMMNLRNDNVDLSLVDDREMEEEALDDDEIIMDENYESPVQIDISQFDQEQSLSESANNIMKNLGKIFSSNDNDDNNQEPPKNQRGLFGSMFSKETIQLDFNDGK